jgi:dehydrogenase/reductase SDR family protein 12
MIKTLASLLFYGRFARAFSVLGYRRAQKAFEPLSADFTGQRWVVTGASGGIGQAIALAANQQGAMVYAVARSEAKLLETKAKACEPSRLVPIVCDLSSLNEIGAWIDQWVEGDHEPIDVLVNNVGVLPHHYQESAEGFEVALATNLLGPVLLTKRLHRAQLIGSSGMIINVSSGGMYGTPLCLEPMIAPPIDGYDGVSMYAQHKRAMVVWSHHWNQIHSSGPTMQVMHPGWVDTAGVEKSLPTFKKVMGALLRTPSQGADTVLWLADKRPDAPKEGIWLDRHVEPEHVFSITRRSKVKTEDLIDYLDEAIAPWL